jgi:hypothetical protein
MRVHESDDGWGRGDYCIPQYAVAGCSCTGDHGGSPCPESVVVKELDRLRARLRYHRIKSRLQATKSSNCCMVKVWVVVSGKVWAKAKVLANEWLTENEWSTRLIHDAN